MPYFLLFTGPDVKWVTAGLSTGRLGTVSTIRTTCTRPSPTWCCTTASTRSSTTTRHSRPPSSTQSPCSNPRVRTRRTSTCRTPRTSRCDWHQLTDSFCSVMWCQTAVAAPLKRGQLPLFGITTLSTFTPVPTHPLINSILRVLNIQYCWQIIIANGVCALTHFIDRLIVYHNFRCCPRSTRRNTFNFSSFCAIVPRVWQTAHIMKRGC